MGLRSSELAALRSWFVRHNLPLDRALEDKVSIYFGLIRSWSSRINLVSRKDLDRLMEEHFLDSLTPLDSMPETGRLLDIGAGAGFPGIPLALLRPRFLVSLLESVHKKTLFLRAAKQALSLTNLEIIEGRLENMSKDTHYDIATVRALTKWEDHIQQIRKLVRPGGAIIHFVRRGTCELIRC